MMRWLALLPLALFAALVVLFGAYGLRHDPHVIPEALVGQQVPGTALPRLTDGGRQKIASAQSGRPVRLINFFASWCAPCVAENGALMALKASGVSITGVAYKDKPAATRAFLSRMGDPFDVVLVDQDGTAGIEFGVSGVPETFAVDAQGKVLAKHSGELTPEVADRLLATVPKGR